MKKALKKIFGGLNITWPKLIIFSIIMGAYTALMAMFAPDGSSFHDIAVTEEWWILPAMLIILNSKKPLEAALKTFVFFLISQPLVYLIQVPFNSMGWGLFGYYPYWFKLTVLTFPAAFICWFIKKDKWYSGLILAIVTTLLAIDGIGALRIFMETPPNRLLTTIYCFAMVPILIFAALKKKTPRIITTIITIAVILVYIPTASAKPYEVYTNNFIIENNIEFEGEPFISYWSGSGKGSVDIIKFDEGYNFKFTGIPGKDYHFSITDDEQEYNFNYRYDEKQGGFIINKE